MINFRKFSLLVCFALSFLLLASQPAFAASLEEAKATGLVGELQSGYLGAVTKSTPPDVTALITQINQQRKEKYFEISKKRGTAVSAVEALAAQKAIEATPSGQFIQTTAGTWLKK